MLQQFVMKLKEVSSMGAYMGKSKEEIIAGCWDQINQIVSFMGNKTWLTGNGLTWLDFFFFELVDYLNYLSDGQLV